MKKKGGGEFNRRWTQILSTKKITKIAEDISLIGANAICYEQRKWFERQWG